MDSQGSKRANYVSILISVDDASVDYYQSVVHPLWVRTPMITETLGDKLADFERRTIVLEPQTVADAVVKQLHSGSSGQIILPPSYHYVSGLRGWTSWLQLVLRHTINKNTGKYQDKRKSLKD